MYYIMYISICTFITRIIVKLTVLIEFEGVVVSYVYTYKIYKCGRNVCIIPHCDMYLHRHMCTMYVYVYIYISSAHVYIV